MSLRNIGDHGAQRNRLSNLKKFFTYYREIEWVDNIVPLLQQANSSGQHVFIFIGRGHIPRTPISENPIPFRDKLVQALENLNATDITAAISEGITNQPTVEKIVTEIAESSTASH